MYQFTAAIVSVVVIYWAYIILRIKILVTPFLVSLLVNYCAHFFRITFLIGKQCGKLLVILFALSLV